MKTEEIIEQAKLYFGKNRKHLKKKVLAFKLDGKEYRQWRKLLKRLTAHPFDVRYMIFDDVIEWLKQKNFKSIDWHWLGDLSWRIEILLNDGVQKGYDWDKKLAINCGGTARLLRFYVSDIVPCFAFDAYYMTYSKKESYYEFGPIELNAGENKLVNDVRNFLQSSGFAYLSRRVSMKRYEDLYSDCNSDGNARLFDALFCDTQNYQTEIRRLNDPDRELTDATGKRISWDEFYDKNHKLIRREEYRFFASKNSECVVTDDLGQIIKVRVWRDIGKDRRQEFVLDVLSEYEKRKRRKKTV